jgi:hypothetical protein
MPDLSGLYLGERQQTASHSCSFKSTSPGFALLVLDVRHVGGEQLDVAAEHLRHLGQHLLSDLILLRVGMSDPRAGGGRLND